MLFFPPSSSRVTVLQSPLSFSSVFGRGSYNDPVVISLRYWQLLVAMPLCVVSSVCSCSVPNRSQRWREPVYIRPPPRYLTLRVCSVCRVLASDPLVCAVHVVPYLTVIPKLKLVCTEFMVSIDIFVPPPPAHQLLSLFVFLYSFRSHFRTPHWCFPRHLASPHSQEDLVSSFLFQCSHPSADTSAYIFLVEVLW